MRIDKYLKVARILKRREVGKQLALNERLFINGKAAKPSAPSRRINSSGSIPAGKSSTRQGTSASRNRSSASCADMVSRVR